MTTATPIDFELLAREVDLPIKKVTSALGLLDDGNTVAFVTRYRKDQTGGLDEEQVHRIQESAAKQRQLAERKEAILKSIAAQGRLSDELRARIECSDTNKQLEDLYLPYKPKKQTLATVAKQLGLVPVADQILSGELSTSELDGILPGFVKPGGKLETTEQVMQGVGHIVAERFSERADVRAALRPLFEKSGYLVSCRVESPAESDAAGGDDSAAGKQRSTGKAKKSRKGGPSDDAFQDYFEFREAVTRIPPHRILAINRGERARVLRLRIEGDTEQLFGVAAKLCVPTNHPQVRFLRDCVRDAMNRLILPSLEREVRRELTERAEWHAVQVFARNLRNLLLQPPVSGRRVLAMDPGFRSGNKLAALDEFGNLIEHGVVYVVGKDELVRAGREQLVEMVKRHGLELIAIGNGTACRETETYVSEIIANELQDREIEYVIVNEAGASTYSTSPAGREELPDHDPVVRSAISIGRRLLDPLSELVKINPANIGVGMYQHDVKAKPLRETLDSVVASCVNFVGVELNTASPALLSYVSGLNQLKARRVYEHRRDKGPFRNREELKDVPGIGEATFVQAAGFLRISDGDNPLDATWIHPESYRVAEQLLARLKSDVSELSATLSAARAAGGGGSSTLSERAGDLNLAALSSELGVGELLLRDLVSGLTRATRDPREDLPLPIFRQGVMKLEDLKPGMELQGTVLNVVDFGAFVDVGVSESALIHISRLQNRYVVDPHQVVSVGDVVTVWVVDVDKQRRRVSLTAVAPGVDPPPPPSSKPAGGSKPAAATPRRSRERAGGSSRPSRRLPAQPAIPLSEAKADGTEPLRSFSDLLQFYEQKKSTRDGGSAD